MWVDGRRAAGPTRIRLSRFLAQHAGRRVDLDVEYERGPRIIGFRVVVVPGRDAAMTRLCTNLPRTPFSMDLVARLYRFRWQIELCFKEWKSYANLHKFDTANPHIAEGLIWASLCAAVLKRFLAHAAQHVGKGTAISTRRVAMCAHHILHELITALLALLPRIRWIADVVCALIVPGIFAAVYVAIVVAKWGESAGGFSSLSDVALLFSNPWLLLAGWVHYLAFDLVVGAWEVRDARDRGIRHLFVVPCLALTFLLVLRDGCCIS